MSGKRIIDREKLRAAVSMGMRTADIAKMFGVQSPAVIRACIRFGIAYPGQKSGFAPKQEPELVAGPVAITQQSALIATGGRHGALWAWAQENGKTMTQARHAWFALRLPLKGEI